MCYHGDFIQAEFWRIFGQLWGIFGGKLWGEGPWKALKSINFHLLFIKQTVKSIGNY